MSFRKQQRGISIFAVMIIIALISFFVTIGVKLGPFYMNFLTVRSVMNGLLEPAEPIEYNAHAFRSFIQKGLDINSVDGFKPEDFKIERSPNGNAPVVSVAYERRTHLFFNVDAVVSFEHQVELPPEKQ